MDAREQWEALTPEQRARVAEILAPELARGWVPKETDLLVVIAQVRGECL